ncbi:MAG TPA: hypothetical protein VN762_12890 [Steroidobacteraceae bacterium]|nr:hypothetical protein [Steroidobacteraceae bacterium]
MSRTEAPQKISSLQELQQAASPGRDLWPGIEARLAPRRRSWNVPASIAAGVVLVTVGVLIGLQFRTGASLPGARESGALIRASLIDDPAYQHQRQELLRTLPARLESLPPESRQRIRDGLLAIQTAKQNIEAELGRDAGNVLLQELFVSTCQEEIRVLTFVGYVDGFNQEI